MKIPHNTSYKTMYMLLAFIRTYGSDTIDSLVLFSLFFQLILEESLHYLDDLREFGLREYSYKLNQKLIDFSFSQFHPIDRWHCVLAIFQYSSDIFWLGFVQSFFS